MKRGAQGDREDVSGRNRGVLIIVDKGYMPFGLRGYEGPHRKLERRARRGRGKVPFAVRSRAGPSFTLMRSPCNASPFVSSSNPTGLDEYKDLHRSLR
jgi:hypothetical protein